jgi:hypothetical protein
MESTIAQEPDLTMLPRRVDRVLGARLVSLHFFPASPRALEEWPIEWWIVNGRAVCDTEALFTIAEAKLAAAPKRRRHRTEAPATAV